MRDNVISLKVGYFPLEYFLFMHRTLQFGFVSGSSCQWRDYEDSISCQKECCWVSFLFSLRGCIWAQTVFTEMFKCNSTLRTLQETIFFRMWKGS